MSQPGLPPPHMHDTQEFPAARPAPVAASESTGTGQAAVSDIPYTHSEPVAIGDYERLHPPQEALTLLDYFRHRRDERHRPSAQITPAPPAWPLSRAVMTTLPDTQPDGYTPASWQTAATSRPINTNSAASGAEKSSSALDRLHRRYYTASALLGGAGIAAFAGSYAAGSPRELIGIAALGGVAKLIDHLYA